MADPQRRRIDSWLPGMPSLPAVGLNGTSPRQLPMVSADKQHCWSDFSPLPV